MLIARFTGMSAVALSFFVLLAQAQTRPSPERLEALQSRMANVKNEAFGKLSPKLKAGLSGAALNYLQFADGWQNIQQTFGNLSEDTNLAKFQAALESRNAMPGRASSIGPIPVSYPGTDFLFSVMAGFTQSETSTAWCGSGVVTGFNDSGSVFESELFGPGGLSFTGAGVSANGGFSFRDIGFINPGPNPFNSLDGDPVLSCSDASTFYLSQIGASGSLAAPTSVVFLSLSTDGGFNWLNPITAVSKDANTHGLDKDWSSVDPKNPKNIYVTYTDFDISGEISPGTALCPNAERVAIEIVHSTDGGVTWSSPTVVDQVCSSASVAQLVQGSQIVVDASGRVYVEWEYFPQGLSGSTRELRIALSSNQAVSFQPFTKIADAIATGDGYALQGYFRSFLTGNLAIDRSGTKRDGNLYLTWEDGRLLSRTDLESPFGRYQYANVLLSGSSDGGKTWSSPVRVNNDSLESSASSGIDHYQPGVAVDPAGALGACWYDRREAPINYRVSRYCATSSDGGATWTNLRVDPGLWSPVHATDAFINLNYLGDYDTVASDKLKLSTGFQGAYGNVSFSGFVPNQDVLLAHIYP